MQKLAEYFETKTRDNGEKYVTLKDERPEWLLAAVREAHCHTLPNDWVYAECLAAAEAYDEGTVSEDIHDHVDARVDVYTRDRYQWAADFCLTDLYSYAEGELEDCGGVSEDKVDIASTLGQIQYYAISRIVRVIIEAAEEAKTGEDAETADA